MIITTSDINQIYSAALISRLLYLLISVISNIFIIDHTPDSFSIPNLSLKEFNFLDNIIWIIFSGLLRWDAQHFFHIAINGYTYENNLAFFPLYPIIIKYFSYLFKYILNINIITSLLLSSFLINLLFFIKASTTLYILTYTIFKNQLFSYYTVLFYCISPATIFFLAPYTETIFSFCVFKGMLKYTQNKHWQSLIWFSVSSLIRSNGIINVGFILHLYFYYMFLKKFKDFKTILKYGIYSILSIICISIPFITFQLYIYLHFCITKHIHTMVIYDYARDYGLLLAGNNKVPWCNYTIPFSYQYIQEHYWNVGFFKYYTIKQIPNFCLALPITIIIFKYCLKYFYNYWKLLFKVDRIYKYDDISYNRLTPSVFVFAVHILYLTIFAIININVQVTTRLIASSSPFIYWIASQEFIDNEKYKELIPFLKWISLFNKRKSGNLIKFYFIFYAILGIILFSNNFPWT
ncbi:hypothetical protein O3M35_013358 [Rhynocoris fuscipes]|uniref:GPI mannosyltransferase 2 n=1 Tax=Rhynocoris fuscipes TaxID=488301 RepID=A0AAW1CDQ4_9HEMI